MTDVRTLRPTPDQYAYAFGGREPLLTVAPGTVVDTNSTMVAELAKSVLASASAAPAYEGIQERLRGVAAHYRDHR